MIPISCWMKADSMASGVILADLSCTPTLDFFEDGDFYKILHEDIAV